VQNKTRLAFPAARQIAWFNAGAVRSVMSTVATAALAAAENCPIMA